MGALQKAAVACGVVLFALAAVSALSDPAAAKCFGNNKDRMKYGCKDEQSEGFSLFGSGLFGSSDSSEDSSKDNQTNVDQPQANQDTNVEVTPTESSRVLASYPPAKGPKRTIAVLDFENKVQGIYGASEIGLGVTEILITELHKSKHFIVLERSALKDILKEQELGLTGLVQKDGTPRAGGFAGTQLLIKGVITEFDYKAEGGGVGLNISGINLGSKTKNAHVGLDVRLIDPNTAEILDAHSVAVKASSTGWNVGYQPNNQDFRIGTGFFEETPLGEATRGAIKQTVAYIIDQSRGIPWAGSVIKADGQRIFINRGSNSNVRIGDQMTIFSKGEVLIDPDTGLNLGSDDSPVGTMTLIQVKEKFAVGKYTLFDATQGVRRGDTVRYSSQDAGQDTVRDPDANF